MGHTGILFIDFFKYFLQATYLIAECESLIFTVFVPMPNVPIHLLGEMHLFAFLLEAKNQG